MADKTLWQPGPFTFGFDIGIASVGWCVLGKRCIINLGVRCFDKAETADKGESLNLARRTARLMRHRLRRRVQRLTKLARLLARQGLVNDAGQLRHPAVLPQTPWELRLAGLDRQLTPEEWARVIYHLCKHRGFHWISKAEEKKAESDSKSESGKVKQGLAGTRKLMEDKGYRSAAEMVLAEFPQAQRNKQGEYTKALSRVLLAEELALLFQKQRKFKNRHATPELEAAILGNGDRKSGLFWEQKIPLSGEDLLKMLGHCTFEKAEYRAPKASYTAERHVWLTRLNNLRIVVDGDVRSLNAAERAVVLPLPYNQASGDLQYKQVRAALVKKTELLPENFRFAGLRYPTKEGDKNPENEKLVRLPAWQALHKTLKEAGLESEWQSMAGAAAGGNPDQLDEIARVLSVYKDGDEVERELRKLDLPGGEPMIEALGTISFDKFHNLSLKALRKIVPFMKQGQRYDQACASAQYHHSQLFKPGAGKEKYLPPLYVGRDKKGRMIFRDDGGIPRNPVVLRALNQARKVLNALVREYGSPAAVHIEMARDLSKSLTGHWTAYGKYIEGRRDIEKAQKEYHENNEKAKEAFAIGYGIPAKSREFEKFQLYREQQGKCAYSLEPLELGRVLHDPGYAEVDHALPYSRSYDNSKNNRVLVLTRINREKGNQTPHEYLTRLDGGSEGGHWHRFMAFVENNKSYRPIKRDRLLRRHFGQEESEEFKERNLNDTRYICKFFKNYIEEHLLFIGDLRRCVVLSGQLTAFLRTRWGFNKVRGDSDRHHALDAAVIAACSHALVKRLSDYSRRKELENTREVIDAETGEIVNPTLLMRLEKDFPKPWEYFREEVLLRLNQDNLELLKSEAQQLGYSPEAVAALHPLFISRAPQRRNGGAAHKETIYAKLNSSRTAGNVAQKIPLPNLKLADLDKLIDPLRNQKLYAAIRKRLEAHDGKGDKAFPPDNPLRKPDRNGDQTGPIVRTVTKLDTLTGVRVRGGLAKNDTMLRVDVFRHKKDRKYHLVPVYVHQKELPNRAVVAFKDEVDWTLIDEEHFDFCFSLHPNDLVKVNLKKEALFGYYAGCDRSGGTISLWAHDRSRVVGKDGLIRGIGVKTALGVEKFHVDPLGNIYPALLEERRGIDVMR